MMGSSPRGIVTAFAGALALSGCGGEPTGPGVRIRFDAEPAQIQATRVMIEDARIRLLASLAPLSGASALEVAIDGMATAVDVHDADAMERSALAALTALKQLRAASGPADEAEVAAIDLTIMAAGEILEYADGTRGNTYLRTQ